MKKAIGYILGIIGIILTISGIIFKIEGALSGMSFSIPGSPDGPTTIFLAGALGRDISLGIIAAGVGLIIIATLLLVKGKKRK